MSRSSDQSIQTDGPATPYSAKLFDTDSNMPVIQIISGSYRHTPIRAHSSNESVGESIQSDGTSSSSHLADDQPLHLSDTFTITLLDQEGQSSDTSSATLSEHQPLTRSNLTAHRRFLRAQRVASGVELTNGELQTEAEGSCCSSDVSLGQDAVLFKSMERETEEEFMDSALMYRSLDARGIDVDTWATWTQSPFEYFNTKKPDGGVQGYKDLGIGPNFWVDPTPELQEKIDDEYWAFKDLYRDLKNRYPENSLEHISSALLNFFHAGPRMVRSKHPIPTAERMLNFVPHWWQEDPHERPWRFPPLIKEELKDTLRHYRLKEVANYGFNKPPTIQYWLAGRAFKSGCTDMSWRHQYANDALERLCPYLTVDILGSNMGVNVVSNDMVYKQRYRSRGKFAYNMAVALYNRCLLSINRLKATSRKWTQKHCETLRHYGIELDGSSAAIWVARIRTDKYEDSPYGPICPYAWSWEGCEVGIVAWASGVVSIADWINEIHRWGLTAYAREVEEDAAICHRVSCYLSKEYGQIIESVSDEDAVEDACHLPFALEEEISSSQELAVVED